RGCLPAQLARHPTPRARPTATAHHFATRVRPRACRRPGFRTASRSSGPPAGASPPVPACCPEPARGSHGNSVPRDPGSGRPAPLWCPAAAGEASPVSPSGPPDERRRLSPAGETQRYTCARNASLRVSGRAFLQRSVIAVGDRIASLNLIGLEPLPPYVELV